MLEMGVEAKSGKKLVGVVDFALLSSEDAKRTHSIWLGILFKYNLII
jgi:hypothetical protein